MLGCVIFAHPCDDVQATLEGSMTGGQAQLDVETQLAGEAHSRLESLLRGVRTEECRKEIMDAYQTYMGAQALVSCVRATNMYTYDRIWGGG